MYQSVQFGATINISSQFSKYIYILPVSVSLETTLFIYIGQIHRSGTARSKDICTLNTNDCCLLASKIAITISLSQPAMDENILYSPRPCQQQIINFHQSDRCKNILHCYFNLDFCDYQRTEYILCHLHMPFYELYFDIICSVYCDLVFLSIYNFSLCSSGIDSLSTI